MNMVLHSSLLPKKNHFLTSSYPLGHKICSNSVERQENRAIPAPKHTANTQYALFLKSCVNQMERKTMLLNNV